MTDPSAEVRTAASEPPIVAAEARQRWRLTFAREPVGADAVGRAALDAWGESLADSGLPIAGLEPGGAGRARLAFAAPLPAGAWGLAELAEIWLLERLPLWRVREALAGRLPAGHRWVAGEDIWLGAPALPGRVSAADWLVELDGDGTVTSAGLSAAAQALLAAPELPRTRMKGATEKRYDLRPLLADITVDAGDHDDAHGRRVRIRTRFDPEAGSGRPDEVMAALGEAAGCHLEVRRMVRERLILADAVAPERSENVGSGPRRPALRSEARPRRR